jgi:hypothetical protein
MRAYIAGPMAGLPQKNLPSFLFAADMLRMLNGIDPVNPAHSHDGPCPEPKLDEFEAHSPACHLREDLRAMLLCDMIVMLPGWEKSFGARLEFNVAAQIRMPVWFIDMGSGELFDSSGNRYTDPKENTK